MWKMQTELPHLQGKSGAQDSRPQDIQEAESLGGPSSGYQGLSQSLNDQLEIFISVQMLYITLKYLLLLQVTIRASLTGKGPVTPLNSHKSAVVVTPEPMCFPNFKVKAPVNLSRSKTKDARTGKVKTAPNKKTERHPKHNLALKNLRFLYSKYRKFTSQKYTSIKEFAVNPHFQNMKHLNHAFVNILNQDQLCSLQMIQIKFALLAIWCKRLRNLV